MSNNWTKINDNNVLAVWVPTCDGGCEQEAVEISPDFYEENGTPICMCGCDMRYSHTIVKNDTPTSLIDAVAQYAIRAFEDKHGREMTEQEMFELMKCATDEIQGHYSF